jgi:hypothetical protein
MSPERIETAEDLERIVAEQTAAIKTLAELVQDLHLRIRVLAGLIDNQHEILIKHGLATPRPMGDSLVN